MRARGRVTALLLLAGVGAALAEDTAPPRRGEEARGRLAELARRGAYADLVDASDGVLSTAPSDVPALEFRAFALHRLERHQAAQAAYERILEVDEDHVWALTQLGVLLGEAGRHAEGVRHLRRATEIEPTSLDAQRKLSRLHRDAGEHLDAAAAVRRALEGGVDPAWAHAELGYLHWVLGDGATSRGHWRQAREAGADPADCAHGERLVAWDEEVEGQAEDAPALRERRLSGPPWLFRVGPVEVTTLVGPGLPPWLAGRVSALLAENEAFVGEPPREGAALRLFLARTVEEHEAVRRQRFPGGGPGRSFFFHAAPQRRGEGWSLDMHVAWSDAGVLRSLSHELGHAVLRRRRALPPCWLDEGLATYLEACEDGTRTLGEVRSDLLASLRTATDQGRALDFRAMLTCGDFGGAGSRARYAQAWSMVHFLLHDPERGGLEALGRYLSAELGRRGDPVTQFRAVYGLDLEALDEAWRAHVERLSR